MITKGGKVNKKIGDCVCVIDKETDKVVEIGYYMEETNSVYTVKVVVSSALGMKSIVKTFDKNRYDLVGF